MSLGHPTDILLTEKAFMLRLSYVFLQLFFKFRISCKKFHVFRIVKYSNETISKEAVLRICTDNYVAKHLVIYR